MKWLSRFPDWVTFSAAAVAAVALLGLVGGESVSSAAKSAAIGAVILVPLNRFWLLPPPKGQTPAAKAGLRKN